MNTFEHQAKMKLLAGFMAVVAVGGGILYIDQAKSAATVATETSTPVVSDVTETAAAETPTASPVAATATPIANTSGYKDGTYTASGGYSVPNSYETIKVTISIKNGVVASSSVANSATIRESAEYQSGFISSYKMYVVGKNIDAISLSRVAGATDTTQAFNDALAQIKSQSRG